MSDEELPTVRLNPFLIYMITITGEVMMNSNNFFIGKIWKVYTKYFRYICIIFDVLGLYMFSHVQIMVDANSYELIGILLFIAYLLWYTYPKPKNKQLYSIPLFLYIIGYYIINWDSICEVTKVLWHGIFG